jgi:hypothetical protein
MAEIVSLPPVSKFFVPLPEAKFRGKRRHHLRSGECYFSETIERGIELFRDAITHGIPGLWITALPPGAIRKRWKLLTTPILWVTREVNREEVTAKPSELGRILNITRNYFLSGIPKSVIFIDCLRDLVLTNGYRKSTRMLKDLLRVCSENEAALIVSCGEFPPEGVERLRRAVQKRSKVETA